MNAPLVLEDFVSSSPLRRRRRKRVDGGYRPAVVVAIAGYVACSYLFIEPRGRIGLDNVGNIVGLVAYLFTCSLVIGLGDSTVVMAGAGTVRVGFANEGPCA